MTMQDEMDAKEPGTVLDPWIPENAGDMMIGEVSGLDSGSSEYGDFHMVVFHELDKDENRIGEEERTFAFLGAVLSSWFTRNRLELVAGAFIAVRYDGVPDGKKYKAYTIILRPPLSMGEAMAAADDEMPF